MDYEVVLALLAIVFFMAVSGLVLRRQWADYCTRLFKRAKNSKTKGKNGYHTP